eukprot:9437612-Alexandrium_andersonii.AAC.1
MQQNLHNAGHVPKNTRHVAQSTTCGKFHDMVGQIHDMWQRPRHPGVVKIHDARGSGLGWHVIRSSMRLCASRRGH